MKSLELLLLYLHYNQDFKNTQVVLFTKIKKDKIKVTTATRILEMFIENPFKALYIMVEWAM
ncbi:MAG: hypothetical protein R3Y24_01725 [Eubacteriales bacterium]